MFEPQVFESNLSQLAHALLKGGVAPRVIARTVEELRDHYDDLCESHTPGEARRQLGSFDEIAADLIARKELRSWSARWPWLVYGLLPVCAVVLAIVIAALTVGYGWRAVEFYLGGTVVPSSGIRLVIDGIFWSVAHLMPVGLGVAVGWHALTTYRPLLWPAVSVIVLCLNGGALDFAANWPAPPDGPRTIEVGFAYGPPFPNLAQAVLAGLLNVVIAVAAIVPATKFRPKPLSDA